jgi:hypothetical protein
MNKIHDDEQLWAEFREKFEAFVVGDVNKALQAGIEVGLIILTTVGIECLSGYYAGRKADRGLFVE